MASTLPTRRVKDSAALPAIIDRARERLASARSSAEVLEARAVAKAALHFAKVTQAANETHADCLRMIVRAEMRMADEVDRGQQRGDVAKKEDGRSASVRRADTSTLDELGVDRQRLQEWRKVRDAGMPAVERAIESALADGRAPTKADVERAIVGSRMAVHHSSETPEHYTPQTFLDVVVRVLDAIDLDPCSNNKTTPNVRARTHYTIGDDGLAQPWAGRVFMNPPYGREIVAWIEKLRAEWARGNITEAIALLPSRTDTEWFDALTVDTDDAVICFLSGRLTFVGNTDPAPFPSMAVYFGPKHDVFASVFGELGSLWVRPSHPREWFIDHDDQSAR